jgi:RNA polymerase sigma-70 factor (ECF subfamily)
MSLSEAIELELIQKARSGDDEAFGQLINHYTPTLYRVVFRMVNDHAETENIVQDAFLRAWQALPRYRTDRPFFPYLVTIAVNLVRDLWRKERFIDFGDMDDLSKYLPDSQPGPENHLEHKELLGALAGAVAALPPTYRTVIALRYDAGLSYQEIAEAVNLPLNTVRTHLHRAKRRLRLLLEEETHAREPGK